ncbi:nucleoside hydrolase, partial [Staphylococcus aureus]|nr:nucleoside hydrolase [Staphylococcus aureus]
TPSRQAVALPASDVIINTVMTSDTPVTILATGPLTNVATALIREPRIAEHSESLTLMGGGPCGNWPPTADFNGWVDAEAAM